MLQSVNSSMTSIVRKRILMLLQSVNSSKMRIVRSTTLTLQSVEVARQGSARIGY
jgi:hypothetical protein